MNVNRLYQIESSFFINLCSLRWPSFIISSQKLCSGDWERTLCFSVWDWNRDGTHDFIGEATTILKDISPERYLCVVYTCDKKLFFIFIQRWSNCEITIDQSGNKEKETKIYKFRDPFIHLC